MKKLFLVYNERSSQHGRIQQEVIEPVRGLRGWMVGKYAIRPTDFDDNVQQLMKLIGDDDLVIAAGGDGTAMMVMNAIMWSGKRVSLALLGYGNFNDTAAMLGEKNVEQVLLDYEAGRVMEFHPLEVKVNGELWRYTPCYFTVGVLAEATTIMEDEKVRKKLLKKKQGAAFSLWWAVKWYLKNHRKVGKLNGTLNGEVLPKKTTDYLAVISPNLSGIMRGGDWWRRPEGFGSSVQSLGGFWRMVRFGLKSVLKKTPLNETLNDRLELDHPIDVMIQAGGEYEKMNEVTKIEVMRAKAAVKIITQQESA